MGARKELLSYPMYNKPPVLLRWQITRREVKPLQDSSAENGDNHGIFDRLGILVRRVRSEFKAEPGEDRRQHEVTDKDQHVGHRTVPKYSSRRSGSRPFP